MSNNPYKIFLVMVEQKCNFGEAEIMLKQNCSLLEAKSIIEKRNNLITSNKAVSIFNL